jgi:hypothetical protein
MATFSLHPQVALPLCTGRKKEGEMRKREREIENTLLSLLTRTPVPLSKDLTLTKPFNLNYFLKSSISLSFPPSIPEAVSIGIIFPFTYMCTKYLHHIHPPKVFPHVTPTPTDTNLPRRHPAAGPVLPPVL